ncbi:MAG: S41 family peptidase [Planctomycetota bacterium]
MTTSSLLPKLATAVALLVAHGAAQDAPRIVALDPPDFASELDPSTTTRLTITFDRDMDTTGHGVTGDRGLLPAVTATQWIDRRTFRLQVTLEESRIYVLELSRAQTFDDQHGVAAPPCSWRFATRGEALPPGTVDTAVDRLRTALQERYSRRDSRGVDWQRVERDHRDELDACSSGPALTMALLAMLAQGQDVDVELIWGHSRLATFTPPEPGNFSVRGVQTRLPQLQRVDRVGLMARTEDGIGYLQIETLALQRRELDRLLQALRSLRDCRAMIVDVRTCHAGDEAAARRVAAFFVDGEHTYALHRERDATADGGFLEPTPHVLRGQEPAEQFSGPVAVLTGHQVRDAGELLLMMMKLSRSVVLIGTRSYGSVGAPRPHQLAPGLFVDLPSWVLLRPNGATFDGEGIEPTIVVTSTPAQHLAGDPVLDAALERLRGKL